MPEGSRGDLYFGEHTELRECNTPEAALKFVKGIVNEKMPELLAESEREAA